MIKISKLFSSILLIICCLYVQMNGQDAIDCQILGTDEGCDDTEMCVTLQVMGVNDATFLGSSSIHLLYDPTVVAFAGSTLDNGSATTGSYTSINFDDQAGSSLNPDCLPPLGFGIAPYSSHSFDGNIPGEILITMVLEFVTTVFVDNSVDPPVTTTTRFACPSINNSWTDVSTICFDVLDQNGDPNIMFEGAENGPVTPEFESGTNFNNDFDEPDQKYENGSFTDLNTSFTVLCVGTVMGCTDPTACNYDPEANEEDGTCTFATDWFEDMDGDGLGNPAVSQTACDQPTGYVANSNDDCDGTLDCAGTCNGTASVDACGVCNGDGSSCLGCTDATACNYVPTATIDDGSCNFGITECPDPCNDVLGCTNPISPNYNANATCDDNSCVIEGCTDQTACNYNPEANSNFGCDYGNAACTDPCSPVVGCTDVTACNYNAMACVDNGSCILQDGCTDATACNYDPTAICDDSSCDFGNTACPTPCNVILGCTDNTACNYDPAANCDDNSCEFAPCNPGCTDPCASNYDATADADDGSCNPYDTTCNTDCTIGDIEVWDGTACACVATLTSVSGCTDMNACNFNTNANCEDNSCSYGETNCPDPCNAVLGCTNPQASNYDPAANCENNTCIVEGGCTDATACNFNANATFDDGSCDFGNTACPEPCNVIFGCTDATACNYNAAATCNDSSCIPNTDPGTCNTDCTIGDVEEWNSSTCNCDVITVTVVGCTDMTANNFDPNANCNSGCTYTSGCTDATACNYDATATIDDGTCDFGDTNCPEPCNVIYGCTDMNAPNYDPAANCDTGCDPNQGCTDPIACNYNPIATLDDGTCDFGETECPDACNAVFGCTNVDAENYDAAANCDDSSCTFACVVEGGTIATDDVTTFCIMDGIVDEINVSSTGASGGDFAYLVTTGDGVTILAGPTTQSQFEFDNAIAGNCLIWGVSYTEIDIPTDLVADITGCFDLSNAIAITRLAADGCTDPTANNYDADAMCDDASCTYDMGCTDPTACNYDETAVVDDGSCSNDDPGTGNTDICAGDTEVWNAATCSYDVDAAQVLGCTNAIACNYDAAANCDNGSCDLPNGCIDETASNYDPTATCDDGSCNYAMGCTDPDACNYDETAVSDDGSCQYESTYYLDSDEDGLGDPNTTLLSCEPVAGYVSNGDDPDDTCAGEYDECGICEGPGAPIWYFDADGDGLGDPNNTITNCIQPAGYVDNGNDDDDFAMFDVFIEVLCDVVNNTATPILIASGSEGAMFEFKYCDETDWMAFPFDEVNGNQVVVLESFPQGQGLCVQVRDQNDPNQVVTKQLQTVDCVTTAIELLSFDGMALDRVNLLKWQTASEKDNANFTIEKSYDGINFTKLTTINSQGDANTVQNYEIEDAQIIEGKTYYRLLATDLDNVTKLASNVVVIDRKGVNGFDVQISPVPVKDLLNISLLEGNFDQIKVRMVNITGQTVIEQSYQNEGAQNLSLKVDQLPSGTYFIIIESGQEQIIEKIVKE